MSDWGPVFVAVVLFVLLTPGLLIQVPGRNRFVEFGNFQTSGVSILVHAILYFALICIFLLAIGVHMYMGWWWLSRSFSFLSCTLYYFHSWWCCKQIFCFFAFKVVIYVNGLWFQSCWITMFLHYDCVMFTVYFLDWEN